MLVVCYAFPLSAVTLLDSRVSIASAHTRLVFDLDQLPQYTVKTLTNPLRIVIDFQHDISGRNVEPSQWSIGPLKSLQALQIGPHHQTRMILSLVPQATFSVFHLAREQQIPARLVVDVWNSKPVKSAERIYRHPVLRVVIDPGHGGYDPGAIGAMGTKEKQVVLVLAKLLKQRIDQDKHMQASLTRSDDHFIPLSLRPEIARKQQADVFLSIHADSFFYEHAHGASVFVLSRHGASSEAARWLADRANNHDDFPGTHFGSYDHELAVTLLDLAQSTSRRDSLSLANCVKLQLVKVTNLHLPDIQFAPFRVLTAPDIPSMLIETGFLSNREDEKKLLSWDNQQQLVDAIYRGLQCYDQQRFPSSS